MEVRSSVTKSESPYLYGSVINPLSKDDVWEYEFTPYKKLVQALTEQKDDQQLFHLYNQFYETLKVKKFDDERQVKRMITAIAKLGYFYENGVAVEKDHEKASRYYLEAGIRSEFTSKEEK